jgi:glycerophosphoryl diester phosphodiesterase
MRKFLKRDLPMSFSRWEVFSLILDIKLNKDTKYNASYLQTPKSYMGYRLISKKLLDYCKKNGIKVHVWTINERNEMKKLIGMGVDGIMTDKCRTLLDVARKYEFVEKKIFLDPFSIT